MPGQCRLQGTGWQPGSARTCVARPVPATLLSAQHGRVCAGHTGCPAAHLSTSCTSAPSMRATVWAASASKSVVAAASPPPASELLAAPLAAAAGLLGAVHSGFSECRLYTLAMSASSAGPYCRMAGMMTAQAQQKASQSMQQSCPRMATTEPPAQGRHSSSPLAPHVPGTPLPGIVWVWSPHLAQTQGRRVRPQSRAETCSTGRGRGPGGQAPPACPGRRPRWRPRRPGLQGWVRRGAPGSPVG